ncbi:MAG TPA: hypothetical protein VGW76_05055 [Pyrinomonadaceae bacterium]|nr:hypothetical protein [Pyrinomonadaceae bacterium]
MDREEALGSPLIASFFHIADHIDKEVPEIFAYLGVTPDPVSLHPD